MLSLNFFYLIYIIHQSGRLKETAGVFMEQSREIIYIDSAKRFAGTETDFTYHVLPRSKEFDRVVLLSATIPKTFYLVDEHYRSFILEEDGKQATITLEAGDYDFYSFRVRLATLLNAGSPKGWTYTVEYPQSRSMASTGRYTYKVKNNGGLQPKFIISESLNRLMGFNQQSTYTFIDDQLESANVINFQPISTLFLSSDMVGGENKTDILQEIFAAGVPFMANIVYECPDIEACSRKITDIRKDLFRFWVVDQSGRHIEMNGYSIVISLLLYNSKTYEGLPLTGQLIKSLEALVKK